MIETPVVVGTYPGSPWLTDCLKSIPLGRPVKVHRTGGYELSALRTACRYYDRFLYLQDSTQVQHPLFWDIIDATQPTWLFGWPPMYLGVYSRTDLEPILAKAPTIVDKATSIAWEVELVNRLNYPYLWPDVRDAGGHLEERHGRTNLRLSNRFLSKWKGTFR